ncbi:MAG TPA: zf-HC2 domain-containing protein [Pyrinomonadaceae bacterium]|nr:zf-HC2 domain-containing protein [Pyrinomonadaceae bacterium]
MNERNNSPDCERASDLIAFVYNETNESETRDFELHLRECRACREEVASFGVVRESITAWRDEALSGFVSTPLPATPGRKSAIAALRQFFDLSPLWLKGATALAILAFCALVVLVTTAPNRTERVSAGSIPETPKPETLYTQQDVDRLVKEALAKQQQPQQPVVIAQSPKPKTVKAPSQLTNSRRPLTRAEREQLAADLRLLSTDDDVDLNLLGDRINNQ